MSAIIKATAAEGFVRPFVVQRISQASMTDDDGSLPVDLETPATDADEEKEALLQEIETLKLALAAADEAASEAERRARDGERLQAEKARESAQQAEAERLAALAASLDALSREWGERLADLDSLAVLIARAALSKLFDSWDEATAFVTRTIARQIRLIRREAIVAIRVSSDDFPNEQALNALASEAASGSIRILADPDMAAGECRADLQLGHIDLGAKAQRSQLANLLESLAAANEDAR